MLYWTKFILKDTNNEAKKSHETDATKLHGEEAGITYVASQMEFLSTIRFVAIIIYIKVLKIVVPYFY